MNTITRSLRAVVFSWLTLLGIATGFAVEAPVRIMPLGDSLTSGVSTFSVQGAYRNRLHTLLTNAGYNVDFVGTFNDSSNPGLPDINHQGLGSARIDQIQGNISGWLNSVEDPDVVLLLIGTNDFWQSFNLAGVQTRLTNLIADIATKKPFAKIIVSSLPPRSDSPSIQAQQVAFNSAIPGIVAQQVALGRQVSFVDMHAALNAGDLSGDGVHPSAAGYNKMGDTWYPAVAAVIAPQGTSNPPVIARTAPFVNLNQVSVVFSKPVADSAATLANFSLSGGLTISNAVLDATTKRTVTLTTSTQTPGFVYSLAVSGVRDRTAQQTLIAPGSIVNFSSSALSNGSFENDYTGWTTTGHQEIKSAAPYTATNGSKIVALNTAQRTPNGTLSQTFPTNVGQTYQLNFDVGAFGYPANPQRIQVSVLGSTSLVSESTTVNCLGGGTTNWVSRSYNFVANSTTTTLTFTDTSTNTDSIDLVLDNVRVGAPSVSTLAVTSSPANGAAMTISPADIASNANGTTGLIRSYNNGTAVTVTAPAANGGNNFLRWQLNGADLMGSGVTINITMNGNHSLNAVYGSNIAPVAAADSYAATANTALNVPAIGVLTNDFDADGSPLTAILNAAPLNGTLVLNPNGSFVYTPGSNFTGTDSFTYRANDGVSDSNIVTVSIVVGASGSQLVVNGSFENNLTGWTNSGNMLIQSASPYVTTNGSKLLAFNAAQLAPNGVISQSFATVSGQTYQLAFDAGVLAYNTSPQIIRATVTGSGTLLNQSITINGIGGGNTRWTAQSFNFTANSTTTTLSFADLSSSTASIDLVLDNVRVTGAAAAFTLTVGSSPASAVAVGISPPDLNTNAGGSTSFTRSYSSGAIVNLNAPASSSGSAFQKWQKNGADFSANRATNVTIDADMTLTAIYGVNTAPTAVADNYSTPLNTPLAVPASGVLSNDTDPETNTLNAVLDVGPSTGTLVLNPLGGFNYTPNTGFTGTDSFTYHANDGSANSNIVTVNILVTGAGPGALVNGGFENGEAGWTITGNRFVIDTTPPYIPFEGNKLAVMNGGNSTPDAVFSQTFATTPGTSYELALEAGAIGIITGEQKLGVGLAGSGPLLSTTESVFSNGLNTAVWSSKTYVFTANSATTTLTLSDLSTSSNGLDLLLDNVRVNSIGVAATQTLTVNSTPATGAAITVSPADNSSNGNGTTQFTRIYNTSTVVSLTAPATFGTDIFSKWQKNGVDLTTSTNASVTMDAPHTLTAIYLAAPPALPFANGGFEAGENSWTMTGNRAVIDTTPPYLASEGGKLLVFNGGNTTPDSTVVQTFLTTPGQVYTLGYDVGILSSSSVQQQLKVEVNGSAALLSHTETLNGNGLGNTIWTSKSYTFTANSAATTLTFTDMSPVTIGADLLLDKVSVGLFVANVAPVAVADGYLTQKNTQLVVSTASGVLNNDTDANNDTLNAVIVSGPATGNLTLNSLGGFTYDPATDFLGSVSFTYKASDGTADSNIVTVTINVTPPVILANGSFEFGETGWTMNGNRLVYDADASYPASNGTKLLILNGAGAAPDATISQSFPTIPGQAYVLTFDVGAVSVGGGTQKLKIELNGTTPLVTDFANLSGNTAYLQAVIPFTADSTSTLLNFTDMSAGTAGIDMILDNVVVTAGTGVPNAVPVANNDSYNADGNVPLVIPASGVLGNDTDANNETLTAALVTGPTSGNLILNPNGGFTYTPNSGFTGSDSFTYRANDTKDNSNTATVSITVSAPVVVNGFVNGSFESNFTGWTTTGNVAIQSGSPYAPTNGTKLAGFNGGNSTPNGVVSQTFATTPGVTYALTFDAGVLSYNTSSQRLQLAVTGSSSLLSQTITITRTTGSNNLWLPQSFSFTANSATTTLSFTDTSTSTNLLDLVIDNVVVTAGTPVTTRTLTVASAPATGAAITVSPADNASNGNGTTQFTRIYNSGAAVTLTAPATFSGNTFSKWQRNGVDLTTSTTANVTMDADYTLTAVYSAPSGGGPNLLTNGSFESNFTAWTTSGSTSIQSSVPYTATDGTKIAGFNDADRTPNGVVSQSFATTPGSTYTLAFDAGVLSYVSSPQTMQVNVSGTATLFSQAITITRTSGSNNLWLPQTFSFVADSTTTTLSFTDTSSATLGLDLVLDNVRVSLNGAVPVLQTLSVNSTPVSSVAITVSPSDSNNAGNGSTSFSRAYASSTVVTLTAPATASGSSFIKWTRNNVDFSTNLSTTVTMDAAYTMTAVYTNAAFANGSFETGTFSPWTTSGNSVRISTTPAGTDGTKLVDFNGNQTPTGGVLTQTFATNPGAIYNLNFDIGVLAFVSSSQTLRVNVNGTASLLNQTTSITPTSNGVAKWEARSYSFTADSVSTTLTFTDLSTVTNSIDLLLDNVRVTNASSRTLTIDSVSASAVPLTISPADSNGSANGNTSLTRIYNTGSVVSVTAPATAPNGATFVKWVQNGTDLTTNTAASVTLSANTTLAAIYTGGTFPPLGSNLIQNGSFELSPDFVSWPTTGATRIEKPGTASGFPTDGNHILSFNVGGGANDGVVTQQFNTVVGTTYTVQLDVGVYGGPGGASIDQTLDIRAIGVGIPLNRTVTVRGNSSSFVWAPQTFTFTADSAATTLRLADASSTGAGTDLFVDNVRIRAGVLPPSTLTVASTPAAGKAITVNTPDLAGQGNGTTSFSRIYNTGSSVAMVAPFQNFVKWLKNGQWYATNPTINVVVDGNHTMTAVYTETPVLGPFVNGSFETEFTGWTWSGSQQSVKVKDGLPSTDGINIIEFNSNSSATDGSITQTFTTTPGTPYTLTFSMGVNAFNTAQQSLRCLVTGSGTLFNQVFSMNNPAGNGTVYATRTVNFTANSTSTTLTFSDQSATGTGLDLLLDNVRLNGSTGGGGSGGGGATPTLTIDSVSASAVPMTVSPSDKNGASNGNTSLTRTYDTGSNVSVTAPATAPNGATFVKWVLNGTDLTTNTAASLTITANTSLTAIYTGGTFPPLGSSLIQNGSFELSPDFVSWATTGATRIEKPGTASGFPTDGNHILSFNVGGGANNGVVTQQFATNVGTTYTVQLDVGVYGGPGGAAIDQTLDIRAIGVGIPLNRTVTVRGNSSSFVWTSQTFTFTADSAATTLRLADASSTGAGTDLFVDNVRVRAGVLPPSTLSIVSTPAAGKAITVNTPDLAGQGNGTTNFTRIYNTGASVAMVAPFQNFVKWLKNGQWYATNPTISVTADGNHTMTAVYTETPVLGPFTNGSFESEFTGWTWSGSQQSVKVKDGLPSTDGLNIIEFNSNSSATDGSITQTFTTTPGTPYTLTFDMGVNAFTTAQQSLRCLVTGSGTLFNQVFSMNNPAGNGTVYAPRTVNFTANSTSTTLTFSDQSATGTGLDLLLDNVRLNGSSGGVVTRTLTVASTPANGATITVNPVGNGGPNGTTQFTRTYNDGTSVTLTATATFGGNNFSKWQKGGVDLTTNNSATVTMDANITMTAIYTAPSGGGGSGFVNGNFESALTGWTTAGSSGTVVLGSGFTGSNSTSLVKFNSGNTTTDGILNQTFTTTPGTTYTVSFDMGVYDFVNAPQTIQISATGSGSLLSQNFTLNGIGGGNVAWATRTASFTANSATTTLTFRDLSSTGAGLDLLLDNVTVNGGGGGGGPTTRTLTVSSTPVAGAAVTVSPVDNASNGNGTTQFTRTYNDGTAVTLTAPATLSGNPFVKWQKNGVDAGVTNAVSVTMDAAYTMTAIYQSAGGSSLLANYSFESGLATWTTAGGAGIVTTDSSLAATHGTTVAKFNGAETANTGELSQSFATASGTSYLVTFDMGVLGYNTNAQTLELSAVGTGTLNTDSYTSNANGTGGIVWTTRTFIFTANSTSSMLRFRDRSTTSGAIDLLLDNVRVEVTTAPSMGSNLLVNGSFELSTPHPNDTFDGWTQSGSNRIEWPGPLYSTDGSKILSYNVSQTPTDGSVSQSFATVPGSTYRVRFDLGSLGYSTNAQSIRVKVDGSGTLLNQVTSVPSRIDYVMIWSAKSFDFVADSTTTTLTLSDASASGSATDMFLDNVRVNSIAVPAPAPAPAPLLSPSDEEPSEQQAVTTIGGGNPLTLPGTMSLTGEPGAYRISYHAMEAGNYTLERSSDLKTWAPQVERQIEEAGLIEFEDSETGHDKMFYRIGKEIAD